MENSKRISWCLLLLRVSVFSVMLIWTLDIFVQPEHAPKVFEKFYGIGGLGEFAFLINGALDKMTGQAFWTAPLPVPYPFTKASSNKANEIRTAYANAFQQEFVLRVDDQT